MQYIGWTAKIVSQCVADIDTGTADIPTLSWIRCIGPIHSRILQPFRSKRINAEEGFGKLGVAQQHAYAVAPVAHAFRMFKRYEAVSPGQYIKNAVKENVSG